MTAVLAEAGEAVAEAVPPRSAGPARRAGRLAGLSPVARVVLAVDAAGIVGAAAVTLLLPARPASWLLVLALLGLTAAGELTAVRLRHGEATEELTLFEAAVVVDVLLLSPALAVVVPVLGLALASAIRRRPVVKAAFNLGTYATATAVLVGTFHVVAGGASEFAARSVVGLCLGTAGFAAVNLGLLARILSVVEDVPLRTVVAEGWRLSAFMAIGNVALGTVAVAVASTNPTLLPFTALPAVALTYAYRQAAQQSDERERSARLLALSHTLAGRLDADELVASFLDRACRAFRADCAFVLLDTGMGAWPVVAEVRPDGTFVQRRATTADVALLERAGRGTGAVVVDDVLPDGWRRALLAPLEAEGRRLGLIALGTAAKRGGFTARDAGLFSPLASALGVALRGAEHLQRLVEETTKLKAVVDHSSDGILVVDGNGSVLLWNPALGAITGVPVDAAAGNLRDLVTAIGSDGAPVDPLDATFALTPDAPRRTDEMGIVRQDGEERWVRCAHAGIFDDEGRLVRDVVIAHDVTRERQVDRLKADFIATVSHELRTPVTPIKGYCDLLRRRGDDLSPEKRKEALDVIADRVAHLARLVEDLLLASSISSSTAPSHDVSLAPDDLARLTRRTAGDFTSDAARINLVLPDAPLHVSCDPVRTVQVVGNLLSNALKYSPANSQVDVHLGVEDGSAVLTVTDHGRGIPADQLERIFDKFHRVEDPMTMTTGGTGLGLFIARQLAGAMKGEITVRSVLGSGSSFTLRLPLAETVPIPRFQAFGRIPA